MLKRIHVKGYKTLADVEMCLSPFCVLFGPNAAGKSNLLDVLQLLGRLVKTPTLLAAFDPPYRGTPLESFAFPKGGLKGLLEQDSARFVVEADIELSPAIIENVDRQIREMRQSVPMVKETQTTYAGETRSQYIRERYLRYRVEVEILPRFGILRVCDEYLAALTSKGEVKSSRNAFLEKVGGKLHLRMEGQAHPRYHDMNLDHTIVSQPLYPPHYPHLAALKAELSSWCFFYFEPRERMRTANPVKEVRHIGLMGEDLAAFLNTLRSVDPKQLKAIARSLHAIIPSVTGVEAAPNDLGEVEIKILEGDAVIPARVVSEGTLRVLGLLSLGSTREPLSLVGFEEPENGIHPRRIRMIAELLKSRAEQHAGQLIVTTHSPLLPDLIPDENLYVCRKTEGQTRITPFASWGEIARRATIDGALEETGEGAKTPVSARILRGDFDA